MKRNSNTADKAKMSATPNQKIGMVAGGFGQANMRGGHVALCRTYSCQSDPTGELQQQYQRRISEAYQEYLNNKYADLRFAFKGVAAQAAARAHK